MGCNPTGGLDPIAWAGGHAQHGGMLSIEIPPAPEVNPQSIMALLYPEAFAMVTASNSRIGQPGQREGIIHLLDHRSDAEKFLQMPAVNQVGLLPMATPNRVP